ncbi:MAG: error-prone DNA polymerase [Pseudomonadota bacterium]|nr:error-prone DNA polymerase [Pseudomonadota bacterium]
MNSYVELQTTSNFSFLKGASHPEELVHRAVELEHKAIAITDRNTLAGVVRAHLAARETGIKIIVGARLDFTDSESILCLPTNHAAYSRLTRLITLGRRRAPKGECYLSIDDFLNAQKDQIIVILSQSQCDLDNLSFTLSRFSGVMGDRCYLSLQNFLEYGDTRRIALLDNLASRVNVSTVVTNDVHYHDLTRRKLQDTLTAIKNRCTVDNAGYKLFVNAERHLKSADAMSALFPNHKEAISRTVEIAERCSFSLDQLIYEYPDDEAPPGTTPQKHLTDLAWAGAQDRYPSGIPNKVCLQIKHELQLIDELSYANYFLTVHDIVQYARNRGILCQGRGSAANSAVCYCLGITAVDPTKIDLLFERFISAERGEPPDIDVDFEHERREEVIQYIYKKYGRERAGLAATVIHYRGRSAMREVARAMGLSRDVEDALSKASVIERLSKKNKLPLREVGLSENDPRIIRTLQLASEISGFPRHLSQHVGGFVITRGRLDDLVPIANATMEGRTTIEWDKDDLDTLGFLKIDVLGLGMLSCIRKAFELLQQHHQHEIDLATVPAEDPEVYKMLSRADSVGVFQVESRAQMTMLPRLKPRAFYDLVIEVAIVRPGPIQGDMVHPYLRRRNGEEEVTFPSESLREVLGKTYGVPLFQEQAMKIAIVAAGFTPAEADGLRRAMATFRRMGTIQQYREKMIRGMIARGYEEDFANRCFKQIEGFGDYGFPESHAASFALLVYVSAWIKYHHPAIFACSLLNSQPMGFYAPAQIVGDARKHGVKIYPPDVNYSHWNSTIEITAEGLDALRLGLRQIKGFREDFADQLIAARKIGNGRPFFDIDDFARRSNLPKSVLEQLADADAFQSINLSRRQALWSTQRINSNQAPLFIESGEGIVEQKVHLPSMGLGEEVSHDYRTIHLSLKDHPLSLLRNLMTSMRAISAKRLSKIENGGVVSVSGLVISRQRPGTASGVIFATLEDETGSANVIIWPSVFEKYRKETLVSKLLLVRGELQREGFVIHIIARHLIDMTSKLYELATPHKNNAQKPQYPSRDFQ